MIQNNTSKDFFEIKNPDIIRCPVCNTIICFENEDEALYRNIKAIYINKKTKIKKAKCCQCKRMVDVKI